MRDLIRCLVDCGFAVGCWYIRVHPDVPRAARGIPADGPPPTAAGGRSQADQGEECATFLSCVLCDSSVCVFHPSFNACCVRHECCTHHNTPFDVCCVRHGRTHHTWRGITRCILPSVLLSVFGTECLSTPTSFRVLIYPLLVGFSWLATGGGSGVVTMAVEARANRD